MAQLLGALLGPVIAAVSLVLLRLTRDPVRRLPSRWQTALALAAWIVEYLVLTLAVGFLLGADALSRLGNLAALSAPERVAAELALNTLPLLGALVALAAIWGLPTFAAVGLRWAAGRLGRAYILRDIGFGLLLGPAAVGTLLLVGLIGGWDHVTGIEPPGSLLTNLLLGALLFLGVAVYEELSARGCLFALLARLIGIPAATLASVLVFAVLHAANPGAGPAALVGVGLAGAIFVLALLRTGMLWLPIAFHLSWDWAETSLYGFPDSGLPPQSALHLAVDPTAPEWATGGTFGPEASVFVALALVLAAGAIWFYTRGRPGRVILFPAGAPERAATPIAPAPDRGSPALPPTVDDSAC